MSSGGLDQIMAPPGDRTPQQPRSRSFFQSVTVTKVLRPDGVSRHKWSPRAQDARGNICELWHFLGQSVEERRTVRDGRGHEETTVSVSGGSGGAHLFDVSVQANILFDPAPFALQIRSSRVQTRQTIPRCSPGCLDG